MNDPQFTVDAETCIACGACVEDCPFGVLSMEEVPVLRDPDGCLQCQHCFAVCPTGALSILGRTADMATDLEGRLPSFVQMEPLIKGRRSVRRYQQEALPADLLDRLLTTAWHAPTAVNSQSVRFTLIDDPKRMQALAVECQQRLAAMTSSANFPQGPIRQYVERGLALYRESGVDIFFRGAPHLVVASAPETNPAAQTDTVIALSYLELAARSMSLGTLWNGLARMLTCTLMPDLRQRMGIPDDHLVGGVMSLGRPAVAYVRTVERGPAKIVRSTY